MDSIYIRNLKVETSIGITEEERANPQTLKISVDMFTDVSSAAASDDVDDTIDYAKVAEAIKKLGSIERNTIERFAEDIAQMILKDFKPDSVKVSVWKYILPDTDGVSVTIER